MKKPFSRQQKTTIIYGILCIVVLIVILQLYVLTATMNAYLGGDYPIILPAGIVSFICFTLNAGLLWYLYAMEKR